MESDILTDSLVVLWWRDILLAVSELPRYQGPNYGENQGLEAMSIVLFDYSQPNIQPSPVSEHAERDVATKRHVRCNA